MTITKVESFDLGSVKQQKPLTRMIGRQNWSRSLKNRLPQAGMSKKIQCIPFEPISCAGALRSDLVGPIAAWT